MKRLLYSVFICKYIPIYTYYEERTKIKYTKVSVINHGWRKRRHVLFSSQKWHPTVGKVQWSFLNGSMSKAMVSWGNENCSGAPPSSHAPAAWENHSVSGSSELCLTRLCRQVKVYCCPGCHGSSLAQHKASHLEAEPQGSSQRGFTQSYCGLNPATVFLFVSRMSSDTDFYSVGEGSLLEAPSSPSVAPPGWEAFSQHRNSSSVGR